MKTMICLFLLSFGSWMQTKAQIVYNMDAAKSIAIAQNKLIIIDFWATWCGPCQAMEKALWSHEEFTPLMDRFVLLKIDIDSNRDLAIKYGIRSIPRVMIITPNEDKLYDQSGFRNADPFLKTFKAYPEDMSGLGQAMMPFVKSKKTEAEDDYELASTLQNIGRLISDRIVAGAFLNLSNTYFKNAEKKAGDDNMKEMAMLSRLRNEVYKGKHKATLKKLQKLEGELDSEKSKELKEFIAAYCYKCEGNQKAVEEIKKNLTDEALLAELEKE
ncbi:MAG: thioredoxin domain-containing protein [Bacteroidota bacterium]